MKSSCFNSNHSDLISSKKILSSIVLTFLFVLGATRTVAQKPIHSNTAGLSKSGHVKEIQLTFDTSGHLLNSTQCFSKNDDWIAYDGRNLETPIPANGIIGIVNTKTKNTKIIYHTKNQSEFGPGVGAATFSPVQNKVLFIQGIRNANAKYPYSFARRTGIAVSIDKPEKFTFMDARNIIPPFTPGALRGGSHAHTWSGDGKWISCTYNDYIIEQLAKNNAAIKDIRVVAVMKSGANVAVADSSNPENNDGEMFSAVVTNVTDHPAPGSDEIDKAFDECWIGSHGYNKPNGIKQKRAVAFQGNVVDENGHTKTEVFVADIPDDISKAVAGCPLQGTTTHRPCVPEGVHQRRITFTTKGIEGPRHWLRSTPNGKWIGFLAADQKGIIQIFLVSPNGGPISQLTYNTQSVAGPFNFNPDGTRVAYIADSSVFITQLGTGQTERLTAKSEAGNRPEGAVIWGNHGNLLTYNRYIKAESGKSWLQIFLLHL